MFHNDLPNIMEMLKADATHDEKKESCYSEVLMLQKWPQQMAEFIEQIEVKHQEQRKQVEESCVK